MRIINNRKWAFVGSILYFNIALAFLGAKFTFLASNNSRWNSVSVKLQMSEMLDV